MAKTIEEIRQEMDDKWEKSEHKVVCDRYWRYIGGFTNMVELTDEQKINWNTVLTPFVFDEGIHTERDFSQLCPCPKAPITMGTDGVGGRNVYDVEHWCHHYIKRSWGTYETTHQWYNGRRCRGSNNDGFIAYVFESKIDACLFKLRWDGKMVSYREYYECFF